MRFLLRVLIVFFIVMAGLSLFRSAFSAGKPRKARRGNKPADPARRGGKLVKDPVCGTYVTPESALSTSANGEMLYFCSEECLNAFRQS